MSKRKRIVPNVIRGGVAIPLGANYFLMKGNTHEEGGIDIGKDLEVENGEIIKTNPKSIKVLSNAPIMNGITPAQLALGGLKDGTFEQRFNKGFKYQEKFKDMNGLKDDGTKAILGKIKKWINEDSEIDPTRKGGYSKSSEKRRFSRSTKLDPTAGFGPGAYMMQSASGEEQQYYREYLGLPSKVPGMNPKAKTEWDDEVEAKKVKNGELPSDFYGTTKRMDLNLQAVADTSNTGKIYRNYDEYKKSYPDLPSKRTMKKIYETGKRVLDNPNQWQQVEGDDVAIKERFELSTNESNPLGMLGDFGMKWSPEENKIYIHDTYDFPEILTGKGRPMFDRPKEMKIRGRIDFDPKKGSYLLRDDMNNYNNYPEPLMVDRNSLELKYKLGGKSEMNRNKRNIPSTGKKIKANMGIVKNPAFGELYKNVTGNELQLERTPLGNTIEPVNPIVGRAEVANPSEINVPEPSYPSLYNTTPITAKAEISNPVGISVPESYEKTNGNANVSKTYEKTNDGSIGKKGSSDKVSFLEANPNFLGNAITAGANIIGSTISYFTNRKMLKDLKGPIRPESLQAAKLKTNINIKPQVNQLRRTIDKYNRFVDRNTASSQVAAGRLLNNEVSYVDSYNQLYGSKENQETQLINKDKLNSQEVAKYNLEKHNEWVNDRRDFSNMIREKQSENTQDYIKNLTGSFGNFLTNNAQWRNSMANIAALSSAYPDVTPELMYSKGIPYSLWLKQRQEAKFKKKLYKSL